MASGLVAAYGSHSWRPSAMRLPVAVRPTAPATALPATPLVLLPPRFLAQVTALLLLLLATLTHPSVSRSAPLALPTPAWVTDSHQAGAQYGTSVASAGDVNKDGFEDALVTAITYTGTAASEGQALLYLGGPAGLSTTPAWTFASGQAGARLGFRAVGVGDVNGD